MKELKIETFLSSRILFEESDKRPADLIDSLFRVDCNHMGQISR